VNNHRWRGLGALCLLVACSKSEGAHQVASAAPVVSAAGSAVASSAPSSLPTQVASAAAVAPGAEGPPSSFAGGTKETIENAVGLGCEARSAGGFLELLCRKKNGTGGHPVQASEDVDAGSTAGADVDAGSPVEADEHGELRLVVPFHDGASKDVTLEFSDTRYILHVSGASAKLEWAAGGLPLRRACAKLADESRAILKNAQQGTAADHVLAADVAKFPRLGVCQPAGLGSWALALKALSASGDGAARKLHAEIDVARVSEAGQTLASHFGSFEFSPGGLEISALQIYDYDDDGKDELIVPYEVTAVPSGMSPPHPPSIWAFSDNGVTSYAKGPEVTAGGASIEQLDFDMRPDIGGYGPYAAWFGADCGLKQCPSRLTGPRFFAHSLATGSFSQDDAAAKAALKRACPKKPESIVQAANAAQSAKNLVCARALGVSAEAVSTELTQKHAALCGDAVSCPLASALEAWAKITPPIILEVDKAAAAGH